MVGRATIVYRLARKKVEIYDYPDGRIEVRYNGLSLPYTTFDRIRRIDQGAIVEKKRLSEALEMCREIQAALPPKTRSGSAPRRSAQSEHIFRPAIEPAPIKPPNPRLADGLAFSQELAAKLKEKRPRGRPPGSSNRIDIRQAAE